MYVSHTHTYVHIVRAVCTVHTALRKYIQYIQYVKFNIENVYNAHRGIGRAICYSYRALINTLLIILVHSLVLYVAFYIRPLIKYVELVCVGTLV